MSNDPLPLPKMSASSPDEAADADYEAIYAELAATERGRRFLTEYADRHRHAETNMLAEALARVEAAMRGDTLRDSKALTGQVAALAVVIERLEAEVARASEPESSAAAERIQDVVSVLRDLAGRINDLIAVAAPDAGDKQEAAVGEDAIASVAAQPTVATAHAAEEGEAFAEEALAPSGLLSELSEAEVLQDDHFEPDTAAAARTDVVVEVTVTGAVFQEQLRTETPDAAIESFELPTAQAFASEAAENERGETPVHEETPEIRSGQAPAAEPLDDRTIPPVLPVFDVSLPAAVSAPTSASSEQTLAAGVSAPSGVAASVLPAAEPARPPKPSASDPLAALRELSEEELVALFS